MENKLGDKGFKGFGKGFGKEIQRYLDRKVWHAVLDLGGRRWPADSIEDPLGGITAGPPFWNPDPTENSVRKALRFIEKPSKNHARRLPRLPETIKTHVNVASQSSKS